MILKITLLHKVAALNALPKCGYGIDFFSRQFSHARAMKTLLTEPRASQAQLVIENESD